MGFHGNKKRLRPPHPSQMRPLCGLFPWLSLTFVPLGPFIHDITPSYTLTKLVVCRRRPPSCTSPRGAACRRCQCPSKGKPEEEESGRWKWWGDIKAMSYTHTPTKHRTDHVHTDRCHVTDPQKRLSISVALSPPSL